MEDSTDQKEGSLLEIVGVIDSMRQGLGSDIRWGEIYDFGEGAYSKVLYPSGVHEDLPRLEIELLVALHEKRNGLVF